MTFRESVMVGGQVPGTLERQVFASLFVIGYTDAALTKILGKGPLPPPGWAALNVA